MSSQVAFINFVIQNKLAKWLVLGIAILVFFVFSYILNWSSYYFLGLASIGALAFFLFYRPMFSLFALVIIRMLLDYPGENLFITISNSYTISFSQAIGIIIFLAGAVYFTRNFAKLKYIPLKIPISAYFIFLSFSLFYSIDLFSTSKELLRIFDLIFLYFLSFSVINTKKKYDLLLKVLIASSFVPILVGFYQYIFHIGYTDAAFSVPRIFGTFSHPNSFSLYLFSIIAVLFLYYFLNKSDKLKALSMFLVPVYLLVIILTYTRVAWIAVLVFAVILGLFKFRKPLVFMLITIIAIYAFSPSVQERANEAIYQSPGSSISWRLTLWKDSINGVFSNERQALGYGANTFEIVAENSRGLKRGSVAAHNDFIRSFIEGGLAGLLMFVFYLVYILAYLLVKYRKSGSQEQKIVIFILLVLFFTMSVASTTDNIMRNTPLQWIFWITLGASLRVFSNYKNTRGRGRAK